MEIHQLQRTPLAPCVICRRPFDRATTSCLNSHRLVPLATSTVPRKAVSEAPPFNWKSTRFRPSKSRSPTPKDGTKPLPLRCSIPDRERPHSWQCKPLDPVASQIAGKGPSVASVPIQPISLEAALQRPNAPIPAARLSHPPKRRLPPSRTASRKHGHPYSTTPFVHRPP